ncbi:MAG: MinD/ParA family protein [Phycisphaerales bacterium]|nr:MinD/ParA family protein [Phycisphaerales bacterium]
MTTMTQPPGQDQAARLRQMVAASTVEPKPESRVELKPTKAPQPSAGPAPTVRPSAPVVAIASGKGGVGKTNLAVALAIGLARCGRRTALIDADLGVANADVLCGVRTTAHLGQVIAGERTIMDIAEPVNGGFLLVPGGSGIASLADLDDPQRARLFDALAQLDAKCDAMVVDCGAGVSRSVRRLVHAADLALIVTTPEPTAIADAYSLIKCVATEAIEAGQPPHGRIAIVVNQVNDPGEAQRVFARIAGVCEKFLKFRPAFAGAVCYDRVVPQAVRARKPFFHIDPKSGATRDALALAAYVHKGLPNQSASRLSFFKRLAARFTRSK